MGACWYADAWPLLVDASNTSSVKTAEVLMRMGIKHCEHAPQLVPHEQTPCSNGLVVAIFCALLFSQNLTDCQTAILCAQGPGMGRFSSYRLLVVDHGTMINKMSMEGQHANGGGGAWEMSSG